MGPAVEFDLAELPGVAAGRPGVDFHQRKKEGKARIGHEALLAAAEILRPVDPPGESEHMVADEPDHILPLLLVHPQAPQHLIGRLCPFPVVPEGPNAPRDLLGRRGFADIVQKRRPGQTAVDSGREVAHRQQGVGKDIPFRMMIGGLGNSFKTIDLRKQIPQTPLLPEGTKALLGIGVQEMAFDEGQIVHTTLVVPGEGRRQRGNSPLVEIVMGRLGDYP